MVNSHIDYEVKVIIDEVEFKLQISGNINKHILIALHGGPGKGFAYLKDSTAFSKLEEDFLIIYFDQRGSKNNPYDIKKGLEKKLILNDVLQIVKYVTNQYKDKKIFLLGVSFGGWLGFNFVDNYSKMISAFIAVCPAIIFTTDQVKEREMKFKDRIASADSFDKQTNTVKNLIMMKDFFLSDMYQDRLKKINIPVLILQGKNDAICNEKILHKECDKADNPNLVYCAFENCGHNVFVEAEKEFVANIRAFAQKLEDKR